MSDAHTRSTACLAAIFLAVLVGAGVRAAALTADSLWLDECVTLWTVQAPTWADLVHRSLHYTTNSPLYFAIVRLCSLYVSPAEIGLRLPSTLFGIGTVPVAAGLAWRLWRRQDLSVAVAWLVALHPSGIYFAVDGRPYALSIFLTLGSFWAFVEAARTGRTRWQVAAALMNLALIYVHYLYGLVPATQTALLIVRYFQGRLSFKALALWLLLQAVCLAALAPLVPQIRSLAGRRYTVTSLHVPPAYETLDRFVSPHLLRWLLVGAIVGLGLALGRRQVPAWTLSLEDAWPLALVLAWFFVPALLLYLGSLKSSLNMVTPRFLSPYEPAGLMLVASLIFGLRPRWAAWLILVIVLALTLAVELGPPRQWRRLHDQEDWRASLSHVAQRIRPEEPLLLRSGLAEARDRHMLNDPLGASYINAPLAAAYFDRPAQAVALPFEWSVAEFGDYIDRRIVPVLQQAEGFWLVVRTRYEPAYPDRVHQWLADRFPGVFQLEETRPFKHVLVRHYRRVPQAASRPAGP